MNLDGISIPNYEATTKLAIAEEEPSVEEYVIALWSALYQDPFYELRLLAAGNEAPSQENHENAGPYLHRRLGALPPVELMSSDSTPRQEIEKAGVANEIDAAKLRLLEHPLLSGNPSIFASTSYLREVAARALVAQSAIMCMDRGVTCATATSADVRDELVRVLATELSETHMAVEGIWESAAAFIGRAIFRDLAAVGTWYVGRQRGSLMNLANNAAGDVLLYQARGERIRERIAQQLADLDEPRVVLAHSLGGIAAVDLLRHQDL